MGTKKKSHLTNIEKIMLIAVIIDIINWLIDRLLGG
jgi:hypothetical protein